MVMPIRTYRMDIKDYGKRKSIINSVTIACLCFFPYIGFSALIYVSYIYAKEKIKIWVNKDPTNPKNISDPNFISPPEKVKKAEIIDDRFEILDL